MLNQLARIICEGPPPRALFSPFLFAGHLLYIQLLRRLDRSPSVESDRALGGPQWHVRRAFRQPVSPSERASERPSRAIVRVSIKRASGEGRPVKIRPPFFGWLRSCCCKVCYTEEAADAQLDERLSASRPLFFFLWKAAARPRFPRSLAGRSIPPLLLLLPPLPSLLIQLAVSFGLDDLRRRQRESERLAEERVRIGAGLLPSDGAIA